jgi:hypothetical protein
MGPRLFPCGTPRFHLDELEKMKCSNNAIDFFKSYFNDRSQFVQLNSIQNNEQKTYVSECLLVKQGVAQGTKLAPEFFKIACNEIYIYILHIHQLNNLLMIRHFLLQEIM